MPSDLQPLFKVMQRVPGSWHQAPVLRLLPLQVFGLGWFLSEVLRAFEIGLLHLGPAFHPLAGSSRPGLPSHPADAVNLMYTTGFNPKPPEGGQCHASGW